MCHAQASDATQTGDSQVQKTPQDSQISSIAQLGDTGGSNAWNNQGSKNEQQAGNLTMNSMFNSSLATELGMNANGADISKWGNQFQTLGAELSTIGQDFTQLGKDLATTETDINQIMNTFGTAGTGQPTGSD